MYRHIWRLFEPGFVVCVEQKYYLVRSAVPNHLDLVAEARNNPIQEMHLSLEDSRLQIPWSLWTVRAAVARFLEIERGVPAFPFLDTNKQNPVKAGVSARLLEEALRRVIVGDYPTLLGALNPWTPTTDPFELYKAEERTCLISVCPQTSWVAWVRMVQAENKTLTHAAMRWQDTPRFHHQESFVSLWGEEGKAHLDNALREHWLLL
jgi:hypothetical protein